ncbi:EboA domain-containing protein [Streptomyces sp. NBC_01275]|uniref:EboA domain-containing protein n=1 Tax=Streptomyces sp. NBC_01275 TaxID=2903807 RepID=UPI0022587E70|nr:EboA domain-containing protein [Streptomyces sp. NBC_01275]MCX4766259.1 EboA domain-containing protein [Streptomyces sp. NBC_01275]
MTHPHADRATPGTTAAGHKGATLALATAAPVPLDALRSHLDTHLHGPARVWFQRALDEAARQPGTHGPISVWELRLAEAGRRCGSRYADAVRVLILDAARADPAALTRVYFQGTADERRAVLHALPHLVPGPDALPLIEDALRTNDTRLLAAAVGPYAARHLDAHGWRHAVLKCLFAGVSVDAVADLEHRARADAELARMLGDHAAERTAAGRPVPQDLRRVLALTAVDPQAADPQAADPQAADPQAVGPHAVGPHATEPHTAVDLPRTDPQCQGASPHRPAHPRRKES